MTEIEILEDSVLEGRVDPLDVYRTLHQMKTEAEKGMKQILDVTIDEFDKYGEKSLDKHGATFKKASSGRYTYKHYDRWNEVNDERKEIEDKMKQAYKGMTIVDEETGEQIPAADYTPNRESISVKLNG